jgi:hypothetical protein
MTTTEVRQQIDAMSDEDRFFASAYLTHLANEHDAERPLLLEKRMNRMDAGRKFTLEQLADVHLRLESQGL